MQDSSPPAAARPATPPPASAASARGPSVGGSPEHVASALTPSPAASGPSGRPTSRNTSMSMSLYHLGIVTSPLASPLRRQVSFRARDADENSSDDNGGDDDEDNGDHDDEDDDGSSRKSNNSYEESLAEDSKDVLIDRLNDLVRHLTESTSSPSVGGGGGHPGASPSTGSHAYLHDGQVISALHSRVDEMESVLAAAEAAAATSRQSHRRHRRQRSGGSGRLPPRMMTSRESTQTSVDEATTDATTDLPQRSRFLLEAAPIISDLSVPLPVLVASASVTDVSQEGVRLPGPPEEIHGEHGGAGSPPLLDVTRDNPAREDPAEEEPTPTKPASVPRQVTAACDELADDLSTVLANLTRRTQEAEAIQKALLDQLVAAEERIAALEANLQALAAAAADQQEAHASEVSFLRLQLRGIEVRCRAYVPADADPELAESIENWKADWAALQAKLAEERKQKGGEEEEEEEEGCRHSRPILPKSQFSQHSHSLSILDDSLVLGHRYDITTTRQQLGRSSSTTNTKNFATNRSSVLSGG